ncbi:MAG: beta-propeller domain-containing protein [Clostridia bacterium]|nr:beta-propeller domain-containing protein [Clostridia bacterium]
MKKDIDFIKERLQNEAVELPQTLSGDSIVSLVANETQAKAKKRNIVPYLVSAAAVFAIVFGVLFGTGVLGNKPEVKLPPVSQSGEIEKTGENESAEPEKKTSDYSEIAKLLKKHKREYSGGGIKSFFSGTVNKAAADYDTVAEESVAAAPSSEQFSTADGDYSQLNTRTEGVDEEDVMKTDGKYIYVLSSKNGNAGRRYFAYDYAYSYSYAYPYYGASFEYTFSVLDKDLNKISETKLSAVDENSEGVMTQRSYDGFFLYDGRVIFTGNETQYSGKGLKYNEEEGYWDFDDPEKIETKTRCFVSFYDFSDVEAPKHENDVYFSGTFLSSRITGGKLVAVTRYCPDYETFDYSDYKTFIPEAGEKNEFVDADDIVILDKEESNFTTVSIVSIVDKPEVKSVSLLGQAWELYCSGENVYVYGEKGRYYNTGSYKSVTVISKVNVSGEAPVFVADAEIEDGWINDTFSIDEFNGKLRIALSGDGANFITVLDENMKTLGSSEKFAKDEYIRSVRFMGDTAYVVTFRNTDPLFVFDMSDPAKPELKGEVSLPGFSAYLHPAGKDYLVGIGYDGTEEGLNDGAKISAFDVSDPEKPVESDNYTISSAWLNTEYKNFIKKGENGFIVIFNKYSTGNSGVIYFTVTGGDIKVESTVTAEQEFSNILKVAFINDTLYFLVTDYSSGTSALKAFDLMSGDYIGKVDLGQNEE